MSRAEQKAEIEYPAWRNGIGDEFSQNSAYYGFINGYEQAEKNLALTWEDVRKIIHLDDVIRREIPDFSYMDANEHYKEVLHRFNETRK